MPPPCSALDATCSFQYGERAGIFMNVLSSIFSAVSAGGLLVYIAVKRKKSFKDMLRCSGFESNRDGNGLILLVSLLVADVVQAIGVVQSSRWLLDGHLTEGPLCTFQSLFLNLGEVAIALSTLIIALHTFCVLILAWRFTHSVLRIIAVGIWCTTALIIGVCNKGQKHYYGDTGYWCWITEDHPVERITGSYLWMWITFFSLIALYFFMFLVLRRKVKMKSNASENEATEQEQEEQSESKKIAYLMLFYPAVYLVGIAPISVIRWVGGGGPTHHSPAAILFGHSLFSLSGVFNVILFSLTRPALVKGATETWTDSEEMEMHHQSLSEDVREVGGALPISPTSTADKKPGSSRESRAGDPSGSPTLGINRLPRSQTTLFKPKDAHLKPLNHGYLPD